MAEKLKAPMPPSLDIGAGYTIRVAALDSSGAAVSGVDVDTMVLTVEAVNPQGLAYGTFEVVNPVLLRTSGA